MFDQPESEVPATALKARPTRPVLLIGPPTLSAALGARFLAGMVATAVSNGLPIRVSARPDAAAEGEGGIGPEFGAAVVMARALLRLGRPAPARLRAVLAVARQLPEGRRLCLVRDATGLSGLVQRAVICGLIAAGWLSGRRIGAVRIGAAKIGAARIEAGPAAALSQATGRALAEPAPERWPALALAPLRAAAPRQIALGLNQTRRAAKTAGIDPASPLGRDLFLCDRIARNLAPRALLAAAWRHSAADIVAAEAAGHALSLAQAADALAARWIGRPPEAEIPPRSKGQRAVAPPRLTPEEAAIRAAFEARVLGAFGPPGPACKALLQPLGGDPDALTRFDWLLALISRPPLSEPGALTHPWKSPAIRRAVREVFPQFVAARDRRDPPFQAVGRAVGKTGLGQNLRMNRRAGTMLPAPARMDPAAPTVRLHHGSPDAMAAEIAAATAPGRRQIGFLLWEFPQMAARHAPTLARLDEVWVPTRFVAEAVRAATDAPVLVMGKGIALPRLSAPDPAPAARRARFEVLMAFDTPSSVARKNPLAAVRAFQAAFPQDPDARLTIKATEAPGNHWGDPEGQMAAIRRAAATDPRITLIARREPFRCFLARIRAADCLMSPHRAEGFGYLPAYALLLGTPVVATDHSGTRDYLSERTGFPVGYQDVAVGPGQSIVPLPGARWAEIDTDAAAAALRAVREAPAEAAARTRAGRRLVRERYAMRALVQRYAARLAAIQGWDASTQTQAPDAAA